MLSEKTVQVTVMAETYDALFPAALRMASSAFQAQQDGDNWYDAEGNQLGARMFSDPHPLVHNGETTTYWEGTLVVGPIVRKDKELRS